MGWGGFPDRVRREGVGEGRSGRGEERGSSLELISPLACQSSPSESRSCPHHLLALVPGLLPGPQLGFPLPMD